MMTEQELKDMKMHESISLNDYQSILRVPKGWIYFSFFEGQACACYVSEITITQEHVEPRLAQNNPGLKPISTAPHNEKILLYFDYSGHYEDGTVFLDENLSMRHTLFDGESLAIQPSHWCRLPEMVK
jgi:hypothetical protein